MVLSDFHHILEKPPTSAEQPFTITACTPAGGTPFFRFGIGASKLSAFQPPALVIKDSYENRMLCFQAMHGSSLNLTETISHDDECPPKLDLGLLTAAGGLNIGLSSRGREAGTSHI